MRGEQPSDRKGTGVSENGLEDGREGPGLALKIGIAGALAIGATASGFLLSRQGRRLIREAWQGRRRTRIEDRALEAIWDDRLIGSRPLDVQETGDGNVIVSGRVRSRDERDRVVDVIEEIEGVGEVDDRIVIEPRQRGTALRKRRWRSRA
ncbi:MAG: BON domain-containing protein [Longimicrobiales bacterium]